MRLDIERSNDEDLDRCMFPRGRGARRYRVDDRDPTADAPSVDIAGTRIVPRGATADGGVHRLPIPVP